MPPVNRNVSASQNGYTALKDYTTGHIANPASENCTAQEGTLIIGTRGDCPVSGIKVIGYVTNAGRCCAITGNSGQDDEQVTCATPRLATGGSALIKITATGNKTAKEGKELVNNATVSSATYDPIVTNNAVVQKTLVRK